MKLGDVPAFLRVAANTPAKQVGHRARLMLKRRALEMLGKPKPHGLDVGARLRDLPKPIFAPRTELVQEREGAAWLNLAGRPYRLVSPMDWHPAELEHGTRLEILTLHYMEWLEAVSDADFERHVRDWVETNRPYRRGYWLDSWNSYALSIRVVVWLQQLALRSALDRTFVSSVARSIVEQVVFLQRNLELDIEGNHLVKNAKALLWAAASFNESLASRWRRAGAMLLDRILDQQILSDGTHYELSASYHAQVMSDLMEIRSVVTSEEQAARLDEVLVRMADALRLLTQPDGGPSLFGDAGLHTARSLAEIEGVRGTAESPMGPGPFSLPEAGYYGFRDDETYAVMKAGELGPKSLPAHTQADLLSFELSVRGKRFIVDPGVSMYHPGPSRTRSRATSSHNTVCLDGVDQCEVLGSFRLGRRCRACVAEWTTGGREAVLDAWHDGYQRLAGGPIHRRRVSVRGGRFAVEDSIEHGQGQQAIAGLLLHPDVEARQVDDHWLLSRDGITVKLSTAATADLTDAIWMPDFGVETPTRRIELRYGRAPASATFTLDW